MVFEPISIKLLSAFDSEMKAASDFDRIDEAYAKKHTIIKVYKSMVKSERK